MNTTTYKTTLLLALSICLLPLSAHASRPLCKNNSHYRVSEYEFTKARADQAYNTLTKLKTDVALVSDYHQAENDLIYLEGYLLKSQIHRGDKQSIHTFCSFLEELSKE